MAGPKVSVRLSARNADSAIRDFETRVRAPEGQLVVGINPNKRYYARRSRPVPLFRVAMWNEYGVPAGDGTWRVPPRPAVSTLLAQRSDHYMRSLRARLGWQMSRVVFTKNTASVTMQTLGQRIQQEIREAIHNYWAPPEGGNAPATVKKKGKNNPLVDSGRLADAYEVSWAPSQASRDADVERLRRVARGWKGVFGA